MRFFHKADVEVYLADEITILSCRPDLTEITSMTCTGVGRQPCARERDGDKLTPNETDFLF